MKNALYLRQVSSSLVRKLLFGLTPKRGLIPCPTRPFGLSAFVRVWNEAETIEESVYSVEPYVEEIVLVDTGSTDGSVEKAINLAKKHKKTKFYSLPGQIPWDYSNFAIGKTTYRWLLKWDADLINIPNHTQGVSSLREYITHLDETRYYYLKLPVVELAGDFKHQFPDVRVRKDVEIFTWSPSIRYIAVNQTFKKSPFHYSLPDRCKNNRYRIKLEAVKIPFYYKVLSFPHLIAYHINIKNAYRLLCKHFWLEWLADDLDRFPKLDDFVEYRVKKDWGFQDIPTAANFMTNEICKSLVPYDINLGDFPAIIRYLEQLNNRCIVYSNGKIIGRSDAL